MNICASFSMRKFKDDFSYRPLAFNKISGYSECTFKDKTSTVHRPIYTHNKKVILVQRCIQLSHTRAKLHFDVVAKTRENSTRTIMAAAFTTGQSRPFTTSFRASRDVVHRTMRAFFFWPFFVRFRAHFGPQQCYGHVLFGYVTCRVRRTCSYTFSTYFRYGSS